MEQTSPEHIAACLGRIRASVATGAPSQAEWKATLAAYCGSSLLYCDPRDVKEAAARWSEDEHKWPSLSQFLAAVRKVEQMRKPTPPPRQVEQQPERPWRPMPSQLKAEYRQLIGDLRAHPERYVAAKALAEWGEAILARDAERCSAMMEHVA